MNQSVFVLHISFQRVISKANLVAKDEIYKSSESPSEHLRQQLLTEPLIGCRVGDLERAGHSVRSDVMSWGENLC